MNDVGVDIHKRYSFVSATNELGSNLREGRIEGNCLGRAEQSRDRSLLESGLASPACSMNRNPSKRSCWHFARLNGARAQQRCVPAWKVFLVAL